MRQLMKDLVFMLLVAIIVCVSLMAGYMAYNVHLRASDTYLRNRTVKIMNLEGECSGVEIQAPSHKTYILTAGHCADLVGVDGVALVTLENGDKKDVKLVVVDGASDLMLLTSPDTQGVLIAKSTHLYEKIHTMTHGGGMPAYRTDGELLDEHDFLMPLFLIVSPADLAKCGGNPANTVAPTMNGLVCANTRHQTVGTAAIVPGSSGGPVLNENGSLVGIVSAYGGGFNYYVRLKDIQAFLRGR